MSTKKEIAISPSDWVSPVEAARIRGVSRQAITKLIKGGRIETVEIAGRKLVRLSAVEAFKANPPGRKKQSKRK